MGTQNTEKNLDECKAIIDKIEFYIRMAQNMIENNSLLIEFLKDEIEGLKTERKDLLDLVERQSAIINKFEHAYEWSQNTHSMTGGDER